MGYVLPTITYLLSSKSRRLIIIARVPVSELYPTEKRDIKILKEVGLLTPKTVLAHCCHLHDSEVVEMVKAGAAITSCPYAITALVRRSIFFFFH